MIVLQSSYTKWRIEKLEISTGVWKWQKFPNPDFEIISLDYAKERLAYYRQKDSNDQFRILEITETFVAKVLED